MIVNNDNIINVANPLLGEHTNGCRTTAHAHQAFRLTVDYGWLTCFDYNLRCVVVFTNDHRYSFAIAQSQKRIAGLSAFFF